MKETHFSYMGVDVTIKEDHPNATVLVGEREFPVSPLPVPGAVGVVERGRERVIRVDFAAIVPQPGRSHGECASCGGSL